MRRVSELTLRRIRMQTVPTHSVCKLTIGRTFLVQKRRLFSQVEAAGELSIIFDDISLEAVCYRNVIEECAQGLDKQLPSRNCRMSLERYARCRGVRMNRRRFVGHG